MQSCGNMLIPLMILPFEFYEIIHILVQQRLGSGGHCSAEHCASNAQVKQTPGLRFGLINEYRNCANMGRDKLNQVHRNGFQTLRLERMKSADIRQSLLPFQQRWKNVQTVQTRLCYFFSLAVLIFLAVYAQIR